MTERTDYTGEPGPTGPAGANGPTGPEGPPGTTTWAGITDKPTEFAPEAHKTGHQDGGADEIDATGLTGRVNYVDRGDPAVQDWSTATLTENGTWNDLDCSAIVPDGAKAIIFFIHASDDTAAGEITLRKKGNINTYNVGGLTHQVANVSTQSQIIIPCDVNRVIQYWITNKVWSTIRITICGWFI